MTTDADDALRYIREAYGGINPEQAATFYEDDEDPADVFAAFDAGPKGITAPPQPETAADYECGFCTRGQCARCTNRRCTCCAGNPEGT